MNKMSNYLCTLMIYHEHNEINITKGTILHKAIKDLMSKSQPIILEYNVSNDKAVVTRTSKVKTTSSSHTSTSSVSSNETEETSAESSKGSDSSDFRSISSRNKSESSTESNTFTSPKIDEKG